MTDNSQRLIRHAWPHRAEAIPEYVADMTSWAETWAPSEVGDLPDESARAVEIGIASAVMASEAQWVWLDPHTAQAIEDAAEDLDIHGFHMHPELIPMLASLVVMGDADRALLWGVDGQSDDDIGEGVAVSEIIPDHAPIPSDMARWKFGESMSDAAENDDYPGQALRLLRRFAACALIISQDGVVDDRDVLPDKPARKRLVKARRPVRPVRVITLRGSNETSTATGAKLSKRFVVRGHWRNQPYGPGNSLRRPQWIKPHVKGPDDAPLDIRPTVFTA